MPTTLLWAPEQATTQHLYPQLLPSRLLQQPILPKPSSEKVVAKPGRTVHFSNGTPLTSVSSLVTLQAK